jgi:hypothetical protein
VEVVKLDLDSLRAACAGSGLLAQVGGQVSGQGASSAPARTHSSSALAPEKPSAAADAGGRQSELSNVMQVLGGGGGRSGNNRKLSHGAGAKADRRARVEVLKDKVRPAVLPHSFTYIHTYIHIRTPRLQRRACFARKLACLNGDQGFWRGRGRSGGGAHPVLGRLCGKKDVLADSGGHRAVF